MLIISTKREFEFDKNTRILKVKAVSEDTFTLSQVKNIYEDEKNKLAQANAILDKFKEMKSNLIKISKQPRLEETIKTLLVFIPNINFPSMENIDKTIKFYDEQQKKLQQDLDELKKYVDLE